MNFDTAEKMLDYILEGNDLYSPKIELYAFQYNESGSIAAYNINIDEAARLARKSKENGGEYWGAFLGLGGTIYDDPSHEFFKEGDISNFDFCKDFYNAGDWIPTKQYLDIFNPKDAKSEFKNNPKNCKICNGLLAWDTFDVPAIRIHTSSDIEDMDICLDCLREHCLTTNCLKCEYGKYPNCRFFHLKNGEPGRVKRAQRKYVVESEKRENFYFTFGSSESFPYQNGYLIVRATDLTQAICLFKVYHPNKSRNIVNCSDWYSQEYWNEHLKELYADREPFEIISSTKMIPKTEDK